MPASAATAAPDRWQQREPLLALGRALQGMGYEFTTVTPTTHQLVNSRASNQVARSVRDVFGWSRPFVPSALPQPLFAAMSAAEACEPVPGGRWWRPLVRFSTLNSLLFAHSAFPTTGRDSVFFGPDSHRFVGAVQRAARAAQRVVDVGCGSGVGGIALAARGLGVAPVVLADINPDALRLAAVNAELASVPFETVRSDVLRDVRGEFDLVIANPPYLLDDARRVYRDGGGAHGEQLAVRITREAIDRLRTMTDGGRLLLYTGSAIVDGTDTFMSAVREQLSRRGVRYNYEELDPDVFAEELQRPAYANVERIAAVFLQVEVSKERGR